MILINLIALIYLIIMIIILLWLNIFVFNVFPMIVILIVEKKIKYKNKDNKKVNYPIKYLYVKNKVKNFLNQLILI